MSFTSTTKELVSTLRSYIDANTLKRLRLELSEAESVADAANKRVSDIKMSIESIQKRLSQ